MIENAKDLKPGDRVTITLQARRAFGGWYITPDNVWLNDHELRYAELAGPAVNVDRLRGVVKELRRVAEELRGTSYRASLQVYADTIEACLPPVEPPYSDPPLHPGMLVQADDGVGPLWLYLPASATDPEPFRSISERSHGAWPSRWSSRRKLPVRIRPVFVDTDGQVQPVTNHASQSA